MRTMTSANRDMSVHFQAVGCVHQCEEIGPISYKRSSREIYYLDFVHFCRLRTT